MRLTIERLRTMVLAAGILLVGALVVFLAIGKWRNPLSTKDLPKKLGVNIQQDFSGVTYTQARGGKTLFKIHASKVVQLKAGNALLHEVEIELYGEDGTQVDRIEGNEFEYDEQAGIAKAAGPVEITLMRPAAAPAIAPKAGAAQAAGADQKNAALAQAARSAARGTIQVETSGLVFERDSGVARTDQRVEFRMAQASGSAVGAEFDSKDGQMALGSDVVMNTMRGGAPVRLTAQHAEFNRGARLCRLRGADASYKGGQAQALDATVAFRENGSAETLTAGDGFLLTTAKGGRLTAPRGVLQFDAHNQPRAGHLEGGVHFSSVTGGRKVQGSAPVMDLAFGGDGTLRGAHMEQGVRMESEERTQTRKGAVETKREWTSPVADMAFGAAKPGEVGLKSIHGTGGVVMTGETRRGNGPALPSRMSANEVTASFGEDSALTEIVGTGNAEIDETAEDGARQSTRGDRLTAQFARAKSAGSRAGSHTGRGGSAQVASAIVEGHVVLVQQPVVRAGEKPREPMRATAERAVYDGAGEWLHLNGSPRVENDAMQLAAARIDVSEASGEARAEGDVKATWKNAQAGGQGSAAKGFDLGGEGPAHVVASSAEWNQKADEATFRGGARMWQDANSIAAPVIVLNRKTQLLRANGTGVKDPVRVVLVSAAGPVNGPAPQTKGPAKGQAKTDAVPQVIEIRGGELVYSGQTHEVVMTGGGAGNVVADSADGTTTAAQLELDLLPPGKHTAAHGEASQVERMNATGHVKITAQGREGTGEELVYTGSTGEYVLTGTAARPPQLTDAVHGTVTGTALIFNSRDDSVRIEGEGRRTTTETTAPRRARSHS